MKQATVKAELKTGDGTLSARLDENGITIAIGRDARVRPLEFPTLSPVGAAGLRTLIDQMLEVQAERDA